LRNSDLNLKGEASKRLIDFKKATQNTNFMNKRNTKRGQKKSHLAPKTPAIKLGKLDSANCNNFTSSIVSRVTTKRLGKGNVFDNLMVEKTSSK
jgi:hypothetical protein